MGDLIGTVWGWLFFVIFLLAVLELVSAWMRKKRGGHFWPTLQEFLSNLPSHMFVVLVLMALPMLDRFEEWGVPAWLTVPLAGLVFGLPAWLVCEWQRRLAQRNAVPNPAGKVMPPVAPATESVEEKSVNLKLNALIIAFAVVTIAPILYLSFGVETPGWWGLGIALADAIFALAVLTWGFVGRWPGKISVASSIEIAAPAERIFDTISPRSTTDWWKKIVKHVEKLDVPGDHYRQHYFNTDCCAICGLHRDPDRDGMVLKLEVLSKDRPHHLHFRSEVDVASGALQGVMQEEETAYRLESLPNGNTLVTAANIATRPKVWLALVMKLGDPGGEELRTLKNHMEGKVSGTLYEVGLQRIAEARAARQYCGCAKGAPVAGRIS